jgi:hypothetical protein
MPFLYPADEPQAASAALANHAGGRQSSSGRASGCSSSGSSQKGRTQPAAAGALDGLLIPPGSGSDANLGNAPVKSGGFPPDQAGKGNLGQVNKGSKQYKGKDKDKGPQDGLTGGRPPHVPICNSIPGCQYCPNGRCQQCLFDGFAKFIKNGKGGCGESDALSFV